MKLILLFRNLLESSDLHVVCRLTHSHSEDITWEDWFHPESPYMSLGSPHGRQIPLSNDFIPGEFN